MGILARLFFVLAMLFSTKKQRWILVREIIREVIKENPTFGPDMSKTMAELRQFDALLNYLDSVQERLK